MSAPKDKSLVDFAAEIVAEALRRGASAAQAMTRQQRHFEMQFDSRGLDLVRSTVDETTTITVFCDGKRGGATLNGRDPRALDAALTNARAAADAGTPDDANDVADAPSLPPGRHGDVVPDRARMAAGIDAFLARVEHDFPLTRLSECVQGFDDVDTGFANSRGVRQSDRRGVYSFALMLTAKDGRKTASAHFTEASSVSPIDDLLNAGVAARLIEATTRSLEPKPAPAKFEGDVIIAPECLVGLIYVVTGALSGPALFAGTTPFKDRKGARIASPLLSLSNRPADAGAPGGAAFDDCGVPTRNLEVITSGVLNDYLVDYFFSKKLGVPQTAGASRFVVAGGDAPVAEMIARTKRGILLSRFSGGGPNSNLDFSGIAKNSFYIEDGEVKHALDETMISGNFQELLKNIHAVSRESVDFGWGVSPFVAASGVTISSK